MCGGLYRLTSTFSIDKLYKIIIGKFVSLKMFRKYFQRFFLTRKYSKNKKPEVNDSIKYNRLF
jgi:hypothetical protein